MAFQTSLSHITMFSFTNQFFLVRWWLSTLLFPLLNTFRTSKPFLAFCPLTYHHHLSEKLSSNYVRLCSSYISYETSRMLLDRQNIRLFECSLIFYSHFSHPQGIDSIIICRRRFVKRNLYEVHRSEYENRSAVEINMAGRRWHVTSSRSVLPPGVHITSTGVALMYADAERRITHTARRLLLKARQASYSLTVLPTPRAMSGSTFQFKRGGRNARTSTSTRNDWTALYFKDCETKFSQF